MRLLGLLLLLGACGGGGGHADSATSFDASAPDLALVMTPDMSPVLGIACGATPCAANAQFCCTSTRGTTGECGQGNDAANCGGSLFYCDGPEDCPPAEPVLLLHDAGRGLPGNRVPRHHRGRPHAVPRGQGLQQRSAVLQLEHLAVPALPERGLHRAVGPAFKCHPVNP